MKISFSWQILQDPLPASVPLSSVLRVQTRNPVKQILPDESSLNTTTQTQTLEQPTIPLVIAYRIEEGEEYEVDADMKIESGSPLKLLEKRNEGNSHIYLLYKVMDMEAYDKVLELLVFIKYGKPKSKELQQLIKGNHTCQLIKMLSSRQTSIYSMFTYEKIKKDIVVNEPLTINYKVTDEYILFTLVGHNNEEMHQLESLTKPNDKKHVSVLTLQILNWLAVGSNFQQVRGLRIDKHYQQFVVRSSESYNLFFKVDTVLKSCEIPYVVKWKWSGSDQVYEMLKYIRLT